MMTWVIILSEIVLILLIILGAVLWRGLRQRSREQAAAGLLAKNISASQAARVEKLRQHLMNSAGLSEEKALAQATELVQQQSQFYQKAINLFCSRDAVALGTLDRQIDGLFTHYQTVLTPSAAMESAPSPQPEPAISNEALEKLAADIAGLTKDVEGLRSENADLNRQLRAAEQELDHLGREYVSAFSESRGDQERKVAASAPSPALEADSEASIDSALDAAATAGTEAALDTTKETAPKPASAADDAALSTEPEETEQRDQGLLADLDLSELVGEEPAPARKKGGAAS